MKPIKCDSAEIVKIVKPDKCRVARTITITSYSRSGNWERNASALTPTRGGRGEDPHSNTNCETIARV